MLDLYSKSAVGGLPSPKAAKSESNLTICHQKKQNHDKSAQFLKLRKVSGSATHQPQSYIKSAASLLSVLVRQQYLGCSSKRYFKIVAIQKKLKVDVNTLKAILGECDVEGVSVYLDKHTGEVLSATDMLSEEVQNRKRFLKVPSRKIWAISKDQAENWVENTLQAFAQTYDKAFLYKAEVCLRRTLQDSNFSESIFDTILELDREVLDDNFFESWLEFVEKQERRNVKIWLASKGIDLDD